MEAAGFQFGNLGQVNQTEVVPTCHEVCAVVQAPACDDAWRMLTAKRFSFNESVLASSATPCFSSVPTAIEDIAIAAAGAAQRPAGNNGDAPTLATNKVWKGGSITAIGSGSTGVDVVGKPA